MMRIGSFGLCRLARKDQALKLANTFHAFHGQLVAFIDMLSHGRSSAAF